MTGSERLKIFLKQIGKTQQEFANDVGLTQGAVSDIIRGKTACVSESVAKLCHFLYKANPNWLLTGEGEMFVTPPVDSFKEMEEKPVKNNMSKPTSQKGHLSGIDGDVEFFEGDIDHVRWFRNLSRARQTAILAIAEIKDDEYVDEVKGSSLFKLRQERNAAKLFEEEKSGIHKKGETG